jgi:hypothetical protein
MVQNDSGESRNKRKKEGRVSKRKNLKKHDANGRARRTRSGIKGKTKITKTKRARETDECNCMKIRKEKEFGNEKWWEDITRWEG